MIVLGLLLGHLIADFYFQTEKMVLEKKKYLGKHVLHHTAITVLVVTCFYIWSGEHQHFLFHIVLPTIVLVIFHIVIDLCKIYAPRLFPINMRTTYRDLLLFISDQLFHLLSIFVIAILFFDFNIILFWDNTLSLFEGESIVLDPGERFLFLLIMIIVATVVTGHAIRILLGPFHPHLALFEGKYTISGHIYSDTLNQNRKQQSGISEEYSYLLYTQQKLSRGKTIGYIERLVVILLVIQGAYGAIGFVIAAKALARFKQMDDRDWAEYFLLGTLTSMFLAIVYGMMIRLIV
ncbi:DUF3307 domain-containing protein [Alkalihalobacillus sp. LMS39]|uniref:DUF3307 domain-containing protein n=1 Tax=Alkalihalobacillus sp. LMS39 TaxID=2924032 RepID=UPI001FB1C76C|nr:DUF3307 domain-containing protein [Alkalihalobacillus sp. LMS39]UOE96207.1 DUF3307 domain-containing protein [Alkalihalobacillus sp. LMS39]